MYTVQIYYPIVGIDQPTEIKGRSSMRRLARGFYRYVRAFDSEGAARFFARGRECDTKRSTPLTWVELMPIGCKTLAFDSKEKLFHYVRGFDYTDFHGEQRNRFLDAVMCNPNDVRRHRLVTDKHKSRRDWVYFQGFLTRDENGRVIDLRHYTDELYKFDNRAYTIEKNSRRNAAWQSKWEKEEAERETLWEKQHQKWSVLEEWQPGMYRRFHTMQERRFASDKEHKPYIRGRRIKLSESWGTERLISSNSRSWKDRTKAKRQYLIHKKPPHNCINSKRNNFDWLLEREDEYNDKITKYGVNYLEAEEAAEEAEYAYYREQNEIRDHYLAEYEEHYKYYEEEKYWSEEFMIMDNWWCEFPDTYEESRETKEFIINNDKRFLAYLEHLPHEGRLAYSGFLWTTLMEMKEALPESKFHKQYSRAISLYHAICKEHNLEPVL
jgi:hypothetical protein